MVQLVRCAGHVQLGGDEGQTQTQVGQPLGIPQSELMSVTIGNCSLCDPTPDKKQKMDGWTMLNQNA